MILSIVANTDARPKKTGNPFKEIRKEQYSRVVTGAKYEDAVKKQGGEGFKAGHLPYGQFQEGAENKIIRTDSGKLQLRIQCRNAPPPIYVRYLADGKLKEKKELEKWLPEKKESAKQAQVGVKGKKQVLVRNFDLANIKQVTIKGGEPMELIPD